jgi:RNA polymerase sigma-70 factor (ECF subfamily)
MSGSGLDEAPDAALLHRFQLDPQGADGRAAASELLGRYRERVYLWLYRSVHDHERALDLAQEVLLQAYRALPRFEWHGQFSTWLFVIARNRAVSEARRATLARDHEIDPDTIAAPGLSPDGLLERAEDEEALLAWMREHLDPLEQRALWLRCVEQLAVDDITTLLGFETLSGARGVLQRARRKLRAALERQSGGRSGTGDEAP